jgi:hypothetical protein
MKGISFIIILLIAMKCASSAQQFITIYNDNFAVFRQEITLHLQPGINEIREGPVADYAEPNSVILRDRTGGNAFTVLEQQFQNEGLTQSSMLAAFEGQTIDFVRHDNGRTDVIRGKIIRAGQPKTSSQDDQSVPPVIEVGGKRQFGLPGIPQFPPSMPGMDLRPRFVWKISASKGGQVPAELIYSANAITWYADYNVIATENGDELQLTGWITVDNKTGLNLQDIRAKFVAGNVGKLSPRPGATVPAPSTEAERVIVTGSNSPTSAKELEAFFIFDYPKPISLKNNEQKQFEFVHAEGIQSKRVYVYSGANDVSSYGTTPDLSPSRGVDSFSKISVVREFQNTAANHLGIPLAQGRMRFFRRDSDQQLQFIGEMDIPTTSKDERIQAILGDAASLIAERTQTSFDVDLDKRTARESFTIKLRNHKTEPVDIRVVEHLFRWSNWEITAKSDPFVKKDASTIEFTVPVKPNDERVVSYTVTYSKLPRPRPEGAY